MPAELSGSSFDNADLRRARLRGARLVGALLREIHGAEADFSEANLKRAKLPGADFHRLSDMVGVHADLKWCVDVCGH